MRRSLGARFALALAVLLCALLPAGQAAASDAQCADGEEMLAGLCYTKCRAGYTGALTMCVPGCPAGFRDDGLYCAKPAAYGRGAGYPWKIGDKPFSLDAARARCARANSQGCEKVGEIIYPLCRPGFRPIGSNICSPSCPSGFTDIGVSCQKQTYDRGIGRVPGVCKIDYPATLPGGAERRYDQMTWLTSHNAFATMQNGWVAAMQYFSIGNQLAGGVRALMLDIYEHDGKIVLCHSSCTGLPGYTNTQPQMLLANELAVIKKWLDANPSQIVTLILESYVSNAEKLNAELRNQGLANMVYDPDDDPDWKVKDRAGQWPTINWMVKNNRRLVVFSQKPGDINAAVGAASQWTYTVESTYSLGLDGQDLSCGVRAESDPLNTAGKMFLLNHFRPVTSLVAAAQDNTRERIVNRFKNQCQSARNPPSFVAVDFYHHPSCGAAEAVKEFNGMWR